MTAPASFQVTLPWPARALSPNTRLHWAPKAKAVRAARDAAFWLTWQAQGGKRPGWPAAALDVTFCPPDKRSRDRDNLIASLKHGQDGMSDALGIDDARFIPTYRMGDPVKGGAVVVTVRRSA